MIYSILEMLWRRISVSEREKRRFVDFKKKEEELLSKDRELLEYRYLVCKARYEKWRRGEWSYILILIASLMSGIWKFFFTYMVQLGESIEKLQNVSGVSFDSMGNISVVIVLSFTLFAFFILGSIFSLISRTINDLYCDMLMLENVLREKKETC